MHPECYEYVRDNRPVVNPQLVVEFGSYDINGSVRDLFQESQYIGVDIKPGPGVNIVGNAADIGLLPGIVGKVDLVLCLEVFEHAWGWPSICAHALTLLRPGGLFIITAACEPRQAHSAMDGEHLTAWATDLSHAEARGVEYYKNIDPTALARVLGLMGFTLIKQETLARGDVQVVAQRPL